MKSLFKRILKLSSEKQSVKKYLLYAMGEMVLIVLSLLLALQLNQLNQNLQDKKLRTTYYEMLVKDYQTDMAQLQLTQKSFQKELDILSQYTNRLNSTTATTDSLLHITHHEFNPNMPPFVRYTATTMETVKETGHLDLLHHDVIQEINLLQALQQEQQAYQNITLASHARLLENYMTKYPLNQGEINQGKLYESLWEQPDTRQLLLDFNALLTISRSALHNAILYYKKIEIQTQNVINLLNEQIN